MDPSDTMKNELSMFDFHGRYDLERRVTVVPLSELATAGAAAVIAGPSSGRRGR